MKKGPIIPETPTASQSMNFGEFSYFSIVLWGGYPAPMALPHLKTVFFPGSWRQRNSVQNQLCEGHSGYLACPCQRMHYLGSIISEAFILKTVFHGVFTNTKLVPHSSSVLFSFCSTSWRTSSGSTVRVLTVFG